MISVISLRLAHLQCRDWLDPAGVQGIDKLSQPPKAPAIEAHHQPRQFGQVRLIHFFGQDSATMQTTDLPRFRRRVGVVFQDFRLLDHMTTYENVALPLRVTGRDEADYRSDVIELLQWVGLGDRIHALPPVLSGGEKQRAAIARAVIGHPEVLLADEPTGNVDPPLARRLLRLFVELNRLGTSVVIATHDIGLMNQFDARRLVLDEGRLHIYG